MKRTLWMLIADATQPDLHLVVPTLAWMAKDAGVEFECYLESERDGKLFALHGSTVLGGMHHQQFNYINATFTVQYILLGKTSLFRSSITLFDAPILIETDSVKAIYQKLLTIHAELQPHGLLFGPERSSEVQGRQLELSPYIYPDIYFRKVLAFPATKAEQARDFTYKDQVYALYLSTEEQLNLQKAFPQLKLVDTLSAEDSYATVTVRIAERWKQRAKAVAFGDPAIILSQIATYCRNSQIAVYGEKNKLSPAEVKVSAYTEETSTVVEDVIRLATEVGNRVIIGRQTGDGDIFAWSKGGVAIQIADPNRPAFPIVEIVNHSWAPTETDIYSEEPDDATLLRYMQEGKILATLQWHSGEMAHNEAMLNMFELAGLYGIKMGIGVHAARYETSPQLWEMLQIPRKKGGMVGLIEPVLHSGGLGVMAEINCPPALLQEHCEMALERIRSIAGPEATPRGYYAFMDADLATLSPGPAPLYDAIAASSLAYMISSALPGRNRILYRTGDCVAINQTCRTITGASPFVRVTTIEEIQEYSSRIRPGWIIGTLDAPVIAFTPYIWQHGPRFMQIVEWLRKTPGVINVLPATIARYARLLEVHGFLPSAL